MTEDSSNSPTEKNIEDYKLLKDMLSAQKKEFDLFQLRNLTGECFGLYEAYKRKYPVSEKCDLKCAFYAVYHEVYCLISTGTNTEIILAAAVKRLKRELKKAGITS